MFPSSEGKRIRVHAEWRKGLLFAALVCAVLIRPSLSVAGAAPADAAGASADPVHSVADLTGRNVGILVGTILDQSAERHIDYVKIKYYDDYDVMEKALLAGEIDALFGDEPIMHQRAADNPRLTALDEYLDASDYGFAIHFDNAELHRQIDGIIREFKADGTLDRLAGKWLDGPPEGRKPAACADQAAGPVLRLGVCPTLPPFSYYDGEGKVIGMDIEMAAMIAQRLGRRLQVVDMEFGAMIPSLVRKEIDAVGGAFTITEERAKVVRFSEGYYRIGITLLVRTCAEHSAGAF